MISRISSILVATLLVVAVLPVPGLVDEAFAQARTAVAVEVAPVFIRPDGSVLTPLRTAVVGTRFVVIGESGEWLNVEFQDPQFGRRIGWVRRALVQVNDPATTPMDLSVPDTPGDGLQAHGQRQAARLGEQPAPVPVRLIEDDQPGRGRRITGVVLASVGLGLIALEAAYQCHYFDFELCSDEDQALLVGATALTVVGTTLVASAPKASKRAAALRPQLRYSIRF